MDKQVSANSNEEVQHANDTHRPVSPSRRQLLQSASALAAGSMLRPEHRRCMGRWFR